MKALKIVGIIILILVVIVGGFIVLGPSEGYLERSTVINASKATVLAEVSNMKAFNKWSPWFELDENAKYEWNESFIGVGAKLTWYSEKDDVGNGSMEIVAVSENGVKYQMLFDEDNDGSLENNVDSPAFASLTMSEDEDKTTVKWTFEVSNMSGFGKVFLLFLDGILGPQYEKGLQNLKQRIEGRPEFTVDIGAFDMNPVTFIGIAGRSSNKPTEISEVMGGMYGKIMSYVSENGIDVKGVPLAVYTKYDESAMEFICGIPVADDTSVDSDELMVNQSHKGLVVKAIHMGDYTNLKDTHSQIDKFITYNGYKVAGPPWEDYPVDPVLEKDTSRWVTNVYYPVN